MKMKHSASGPVWRWAVGWAPVLMVAVAAWAGDPVELFNGKDLSGWQTRGGQKGTGHWTVGAAQLDPEDPRKFAVQPDGEQLINAKGHGLDLYSERKHGDAIVELEVMVPRGSNSGVYLMGAYEIQILDSFGDASNPTPGSMGAIYGVAAPEDPAYKKPGRWQHLRIVFRAPTFNDAGKKTAPARFEKVELNGRVIHKGVEVAKPTAAAMTVNEKPRGPLMLQGDHGPVAYRNLRLRPLD